MEEGNLIKRVGVFGFVVVFFTALSFWLFSSYNKTLEDYLLGEWSERQWEYKTANRYLLKGLGLTKYQEEATPGARVHVGETWVFKPEGNLEISTDDDRKDLAWSLKGRGNILEITDGEVTEHFEIKKFGGKQMELNFISDIQLKESSRIVFEQVKKR